MKIYIGVPQTNRSIPTDLIKKNLIKILKPYYGAFEPTDINIYSKESSVDIYIMDKPIYSGHDKSITDDLNELTQVLFPKYPTNVYLNYQQVDLNFNPCSDNKIINEQPESNSPSNGNRISEFDYEKLSENYTSETPRYSFDQVILPEKIRNHILEAVATIEVEHKVFDEWGLRTIIPNASSAMSFYGPPGTGKSMAAEAIAQRLNKKILRATYADIESKFHGEGPKMVKAIFRAAERDDAILFLDEADSLLSKRLTNVSDGSAQAINSMRSQLLICLEQFRGIVIFATNLVVNYDKAFLSRLINIEFTVPDKEARKAIWYQHLYGKGLNIPLSDDVNLDELAEKYVFCGREIKNSVKDACVTAAINKKEIVCQQDLLNASEKTKIESAKVIKAEDHTKAINITEKQKNDLKDAMQKKINNSPDVIIPQSDEHNAEE